MGYWLTQEASHELDLISDWYGRELLRDASADGEPTAGAIWRAHGQRVDPIREDTRRSRVSWQGVLKFICAAGISAYGIMIQDHSNGVYIFLALYVVMLAIAEYLNRSREESLGYLAHLNRRGRSAPSPDGPAELTLAQITDLLRRNILANAVLHSDRAQTYAHPVTHDGVRDAWRRVGLHVHEAADSARSRASEQSMRPRLQMAIGAVTVALPLVLLAWSISAHSGAPGPLSSYYHTPMRTTVVTASCGIGILLIIYKGDTLRESLLTNLAGISFIGAGVIPTSSLYFSDYHIVFGLVHLWLIVFALAALAWQSYLFYRTETAGRRIKQAAEPPQATSMGIADATSSNSAPHVLLAVRIIYLACTWCVILSVTFLLTAQLRLLVYDPEVQRLIFWSESIGLWAIGVSWLTKGYVSARRTAAAFPSTAVGAQS